MPRVKKDKGDPTSAVVAVGAYNILLVAGAIYVSIAVTPWALLALMFIMSTETESIEVEGDNKAELREIAREL
jgi:hypothetical protein